MNHSETTTKTTDQLASGAPERSLVIGARGQISRQDQYTGGVLEGAAGTEVRPATAAGEGKGQ